MFSVREAAHLRASAHLEKQRTASTVSVCPLVLKDVLADLRDNGVPWLSQSYYSQVFIEYLVRELMQP